MKIRKKKQTHNLSYTRISNTWNKIRVFDIKIERCTFILYSFFLKLKFEFKKIRYQKAFEHLLRFLITSKLRLKKKDKSLDAKLVVG